MMGVNLTEKLRDSGDGLLLHWCPGCESLHVINVKENNPPLPTWTWNNDIHKPTFSPSVNIVSNKCHYFIIDGFIEYCSDTQHQYSGQRIPLPNLPDWMLKKEENET